MIPIENWAWVEGTIQAVEKSPVDNHFAVTIVIDSVESVEGFPNRLHKETGDTLTIQVHSSAVPEENVKVGAIFSAHVRRADLDRVFAHPDKVDIRPLSER